MSKHGNDGSRNQDHQRATELHNGATHAPLDIQEIHRSLVPQHGVRMENHGEIQALAHSLWQARGCPDGSPEIDWFNAAQEWSDRGAGIL